MCLLFHGGQHLHEPADVVARHPRRGGTLEIREVTMHASGHAASLRGWRTTKVRRSAAPTARVTKPRSARRSRMLVSVERLWARPRCSSAIVDGPEVARSARMCASPCDSASSADRRGRGRCDGWRGESAARVGVASRCLAVQPSDSCREAADRHEPVRGNPPRASRRARPPSDTSRTRSPPASISRPDRPTPRTS